MVSVVGGSFQLNDYIFRQNHRMVTGRNRNGIPWEKAEAEEVGMQEKALVRHVDIAEPDWGDGGQAELTWSDTPSSPEEEWLRGQQDLNKKSEGTDVAAKWKSFLQCEAVKDCTSRR